MTNQPDDLEPDPPDDGYDHLLDAVATRLQDVDVELEEFREYRRLANEEIQALFAEKARLERIVRASQPRTKKAAT